MGSFFLAVPSWLGLVCPTGSRELPSWLPIDLLMSDDLKLESSPCPLLETCKTLQIPPRVDRGIFPPLKIRGKGRRKS